MTTIHMKEVSNVVQKITNKTGDNTPYKRRMNMKKTRKDSKFWVLNKTLNIGFVLLAILAFAGMGSEPMYGYWFMPAVSTLIFFSSILLAFYFDWPARCRFRIRKKIYDSICKIEFKLNERDAKKRIKKLTNSLWNEGYDYVEIHDIFANGASDLEYNKEYNEKYIDALKKDNVMVFCRHCDTIFPNVTPTGISESRKYCSICGESLRVLLYDTIKEVFDNKNYTVSDKNSITSTPAAKIRELNRLNTVTKYRA